MADDDPKPTGGDPAPVSIFGEEVSTPGITPRVIFRLISQSLRLAWAVSSRQLAGLLGLQIVAAICVALLLVISEQTIQALLLAVATRSTLWHLAPWILATSTVFGVQAFVGAIEQQRQQLLAELIQQHVEETILQVAGVADLMDFETPQFHNRIQRMQLAGPRATEMVFGAFGLIGAALGSIAVLATLTALAPQVLVVVPFVFLPAWFLSSRRGEALWKFVWRMTPRDRARQYVVGLLSDRQYAKEVRSLDISRYLRDRHRALYTERLQDLQVVSKQYGRNAIIANMVTAGAIGCALSILMSLTLRGSIPVATAGIAVVAIGVVAQRLISAGHAAGSLAESSRYIEDYFSFAAYGSGDTVGPSATSLPALSSVTLERVGFTYPGSSTDALKHVSFSVRKGEFVAIVGENGSGKTTLAKIIAGLYSPTEGRVLWGGVDLQTLDRTKLREQIAVVFQDYAQFHFPARDNIGLGQVARLNDLPGIMRAARQADADGFLQSLSGGYETLLGPEFQGGSDLSVGQWQRVALARASFRDASLIILDEPTSALDPEAEYNLFQRIRGLLLGRTVLVISHRLTSIRHADRIYVMEKGTVIEAGSHAELMSRRGRYAELADLQATTGL